MGNGLFRGDFVVEHEVGEGLIHRLHTRFGAVELNRRINHVRLVVADEVSDARRSDEDFEGNRSTDARRVEQELLADDAFENERELGTDLVVLGGWEDVDDSVDGLRAVVRVKRREHEVSRFCQDERSFDRLAIAQLPHEHDVGILT